MLPENYQNKFVSLAPTASLKELETPFLYDSETDELYEINDEAAEFLRGLDGGRRWSELRADTGFLEFCANEGLLSLTSKARAAKTTVGRQSGVSLRYLLVSITTKCNLKCRHCYLGDVRASDMPLDVFEKVVEEFSQMGGIRMLISGGEPTLHPEFESFNNILTDKPFRKVLLTNGTTLSDKHLPTLAFDEIQISIDGLANAHDWLRGKDAFAAAINGMEAVRRAGIDLSIATMIHKNNLDDFFGLAELVNEVKAVSWTIDYPSLAGRCCKEPELLADYDRLSEIMAYQFGAEVHDSAAGLTCGSHLAAITTEGKLTKCGFYDEWSGGYVTDGLCSSWQDLEKIPIDKLECECKFLSDCKGGCRYRAESIIGSRLAPDPVKCRQLGIDLTLKSQ